MLSYVWCSWFVESLVFFLQALYMSLDQYDQESLRAHIIMAPCGFVSLNLNDGLHFDFFITGIYTQYVF